MRLTVRYSPYYPPDRCWIWTVTGGYGERWDGWRPTYPEAVELGLEDLLDKAGKVARREAVYAAVDAVLAEVTHQCPPDGGGGFMPCCGLTPFEVPRSDRMTLDPAAATCGKTHQEDGEP